MMTRPTQSEEGARLVREAVTAARSGDTRRAHALFRQVVQIQPDHEATWLWFASTAEVPGDAVTGLRKVLHLNPANTAARTALPGALLRAGIAAAKANDRPAAAAYLADATSADPANATAWLWLAGVTDDLAVAIERLEHVLRLDPANTHAKQGIAKLRAERAQTWQCPVCEYKPHMNDTVTSVCGRCRSVVDLDRPSAFDSAVPRINRTLVEAAARRLKAKWSTAPSPETAYALGLVYLNLGFAGEGIQALQAAVGGRSPNPVWKAELIRLIQHRQERASAKTSRPSSGTGSAPPPSHSPRADRPCVMIVDDSPTVRRMVSMVLKNAGYEVTEAADAEQAAELVRESGSPQLFILDVNMPGTDGLVLCKHLRTQAETASVPVVFLTGNTGLLSKIHGRWVGAAEYLTKPFKPEKLLATVARLVSAK